MNIQKTLEAIELFYGSPMAMMSDCLRGFLIAKPGYDLMAADFSAIEARALAWLAGEEKVLKVFRGHGKLYEHEAAGIYKVAIEDVTSDQRQMGKVAVLALGYGGGKGAFARMAKNFELVVKEATAEEIKHAWRASNPRIVKFWYDLERAAMNAVRSPRTKFKVRDITYIAAGSSLYCFLPSGRAICYMYPKLQIVETPWGAEKESLTYMFTDSNTHKWIRVGTHGGKLAENVTQAVAR